MDRGCPRPMGRASHTAVCGVCPVRGKAKDVCCTPSFVGRLGAEIPDCSVPPFFRSTLQPLSQRVHHQTVSLGGFTPVHEKRGNEAHMNLVSALQSAKKLVDVGGLEPPTPCLQSTRLVSTHSFYHFNY